MAMLDDDIMQQLRTIFRVEAAEHIQAMNRALVALEKDPGQEERDELMEGIFREAHSLKGASNAAGFGEAESIAHKLESVLGAVRSGRATLTPELCDMIYESIDAVSIVVEAGFAEEPHGLDLPDLLARLEAARGGEDAPRGGGGQRQAAAAAKPGPSKPARGSSGGQRGRAEPEAMLQTVQEVGGAVPIPRPPVRPGMGKAGPEAAPQPEKRRKRGTGIGPGIENTIRVSTGKVDSLMNQAGELLVAGLKIDQHLREVEQITHVAEEWNREWLKTRTTYSHLLNAGVTEDIKYLIRFLEANQRRQKMLMLQLSDLRQSFSYDARQLSRVTNELGEGVMEVRMLPVSTLFDTAPRIVRDLAREKEKEIELQIRGEETELDRKVLEEIKDPLLHLLRNSVDHGIEFPQKREKAGKPRQGTIKLEAFREGNNIVVSVSDDGAGIDVEKVKQAALKVGVIREDALEMNDEDAMQLIFISGISTSSVITDTSGRGVGMDVVRKNVEALRGHVSVTSTPGKGTTVTMMLPLTLATTQELLVQVENQIYGIPISAVERILRVQREGIVTLEGSEAIMVDHDPVSLVRLADVLEIPRQEAAGPDGKMLAVILGAGKQRIAFLVGKVIGQQDSVVKNLGKQLARVRNVAGATTLGGTGQVVITLNPTDLIKSARLLEGKATVVKRERRARQEVEAAEEAHRPTILVADDSLIAFTLVKRVLETAGYSVSVATDGMEALEYLQSCDCDLLVTDVVMPRMNGFELTAAVRSDPKLKDMPVILVTSLESREDKEHGIEVGANAYITKSTFDQGNLLKAIEQLI